MDIDKLQIEVETQSEGAVKGLKELRKALSSLKRLGKSPELDDLATKLEKISKIRFDNLKQLNALGDTMKQVKRLTREVKDLSDKVSKIPDTIDVTADTDGVADAITDVEQVSDEVADIPENATVDVDARGADVAQTKTSGFRRSLDSVHTATGKVSAGLKSMSARLKYASTAFSKTAKKASELSQILKIVVVYGGAFRAFMLLTQGVSEGLQNVAQYNSETAAAMSRLSTMSLYLKNSIGAALYPVIVALTPALQAMTNAIVRAFEAMGQLVSLLSGKTSYLKAKEYMKSYVDTAKSAAKQIKKSFAGMDEITVIGEKDTGSSGSGSEDYGAMFEEAPIDNPKLQALLPFFQGLGTVLSSCFETIKGLANDYLYPWLVSLGNWCAENPDTLKTIGEGLGYIVVALLGISAVKGIANILWTLVSPIAKIFEFMSKLGIFKGIATFLGKLVFAFQAVAGGAATVGEAIEYAFAGSSGIIGGIGLAIVGLINYVSNLVEMFKEGESWSNILGAALGGLGVAAGAFLIAVGVGATVATAGWAALIVAIVAVAGVLTALIVNHWSEISTFFVNVWNAIVTFFSGIAMWIYDNVLQPIIQFFTPFVVAICGFFQAIWSFIVSVFSPIGTFFSELFSAIHEVVSHTIGLVIEIFVGLGKAVWAVISKIYEIVSTVVQATWAIFSWLFGLVWDFIGKIAAFVWEKGLKPIVDGVSKVVLFVVEHLTAIVNKVREKVIDPVVNLFKSMISKIIDGFKNIAIKVSDTVSGAFKLMFNNLFEWVEGVINFFIKGINGVVGIINKIPGVDIKKIELLSIPRFATGGFPEDGLFMANHGEMVGKFSNGKTAVANNSQIVEGITGGVYAANHEQNELLREQNKLLRQLVDNKSNGQIDVTTITSAMNRKNRRDGKTIVPVGI